MSRGLRLLGVALCAVLVMRSATAGPPPPVPPPPATGACCIDAHCYDVSPEDCADLGGSYQGDGTQCLSDPCAAAPSGSCCYPDGSCSVLTETYCEAVGGTYGGDGSTCEPNPCPPPADGACCLADGSCQQETDSRCAMLGGTFQGAGTVCSGAACEVEASYRIGDLNCDGRINFDDIDPFVLALANPASYEALFPLCHPLTGDTDRDEDVDFNDIDGFVACLVAATPLAFLADPPPCGVFRVVRPPPCPALPEVPNPATRGARMAAGFVDVSLPNSVRRGGIFPEIPRDPNPARANVLLDDGEIPSLRSGFRVSGQDLIEGFDVRGRIYYPAARAGRGAPIFDDPDRPGRRYPLVVIAHGNHNRYNGMPEWFRRPGALALDGDASRRIDPTEPNYLGYKYLQELLATHGFVSVSIDLDDFTELAPGILARAWLVLCNIENMERIDTGAAGANPFQGVTGNPLRNRIDIDNITLVGHSRGGEAVVRAQMMNEDDGANPSLAGPPVGPGAATNLYGIRGVWSIAATRFFNGSADYSGTIPRRGALAETRMVLTRFGGVSPAVPVPFLGMWGDADGDVTGSGGSHVAIIYDRSPAGPKQFVWIEGANHNFWNTSWFRNTGPAAGARPIPPYPAGTGPFQYALTDFGDDGWTVNSPPTAGRDKVRRSDPADPINPRLGPRGRNDEIQQARAEVYGLAFIRGYGGGETIFRDYFRRPPQDRGLGGARAGSYLHLQYQTRVGAPLPLVIADFEGAALPAELSVSAGVTANLRTLDGAETAGAATESFFHSTGAVLFNWTGAGDSVQFTHPGPGGGFGPRGWDASRYEVLSFRVAQDSTDAASQAELVMTVELETFPRGLGVVIPPPTGSVRTSLVTNIPPHQVRTDVALLTKSMLKTVRIRLCEFEKDAVRRGLALNLREVRAIRFKFGRATGQAALDDVEFSN